MSEMMNDPVVYRKVIFSKWDVMDEKPDDMGRYQVKCRNCGCYDIHYQKLGDAPWCRWCGAFMTEGIVPEDALTASEVADDAAAV